MKKIKPITWARISLGLMFATGGYSVLSDNYNVFIISSPFFVTSIIIAIILDFWKNTINNFKIFQENLISEIEELKK